MIDNLILSVNIVAPLSLMMLIGYLLKKVKLFDSHTIGKMNRIVFNFLLPVLIIQNIYTSDISEAFDPLIIGFAFITIMIIWVTAMLTVPRIIKDNASRGVIIQSLFRSNYILFALPIIRQLYGDGNTSITDLLILLVVPLYNILAVITLEKYRGGKPQIKTILFGIMKNPIIIGAVIGICLQLFNIKIGFIFEKLISDVSRIATPLALIVLGGFFQFTGIKNMLKRALITTAMKIFIIPAIFVSVSILAGFRGVDLATLFVLYGAPIAVSSFTMAVEMEGNAELAGRLTVFTSIGSVVTIFFGLFILRSFELI